MRSLRTWATPRTGLLLSLGLTACGSVADSDPSFWDPSHDVGGTQYQFGPPGGGVPNLPPPGAGGDPNLPPPPGSGGTGFVTGGFGGSTFPPPGSGGSTDFGSGGFGGSTFPPPGSGGSTQPPPPTGGGSNSGPCSLTFEVTTVTANGRYAPNNVGAVWVTNSSGTFVKTLRAWGTIRIGNATSWENSSAGNVVDAVTGATRRSHGNLGTSNWDCTDVNHAPVPDGEYTMNVTFAESDSFPFFGPLSPAASVKFQKGAPADVSGTDTANFKSMHVSLH